jgi:hypothetical protein
MNFSQKIAKNNEFYDKKQCKSVSEISLAKDEV